MSNKNKRKVKKGRLEGRERCEKTFKARAQLVSQVGKGQGETAGTMSETSRRRNAKEHFSNDNETWALDAIAFGGGGRPGYLVEPFGAMDVGEEHPRRQLGHVGRDQVAFVGGGRQLGASTPDPTGFAPPVAHHRHDGHHRQQHPRAGGGYAPEAQRVHGEREGQTVGGGPDGLQHGGGRDFVRGDGLVRRTGGRRFSGGRRVRGGFFLLLSVGHCTDGAQRLWSADKDVH